MARRERAVDERSGRVGTRRPPCLRAPSRAASWALRVLAPHEGKRKRDRDGVVGRRRKDSTQTQKPVQPDLSSLSGGAPLCQVCQQTALQLQSPNAERRTHLRVSRLRAQCAVCVACARAARKCACARVCLLRE